MKYLISLLAAALGLVVIVLGGMDDSPGAQLIGLLFIVAAVVFGVRTYRRSVA